MINALSQCLDGILFRPYRVLIDDSLCTLGVLTALITRELSQHLQSAAAAFRVRHTDISKNVM